MSAEIMELHHKKHHQTNVTALNAAAEKYAEVGPQCGSWPLEGTSYCLRLHTYQVNACAWQADSKGDVATMIALEGALKFNGGGALRRVFLSRSCVLPQLKPVAGAGHVNHSIFWTNLVPPKVRTAPCLCPAGIVPRSPAGIPSRPSIPAQRLQQVALRTRTPTRRLANRAVLVRARRLGGELLGGATRRRGPEPGRRASAGL